jgi:hypothetical protein
MAANVLAVCCPSPTPLQCVLAQLPKDPYAIILHSSFLIDVQGSYQSGYTALQVTMQSVAFHATAKSAMVV